MGNDTSLRDDDVSEKLVQPDDVSIDETTTRSRCDSLLVVPDGELQVPWDDTLLLVIPRSVTGELEDLGREILKDSREVDYERHCQPLMSQWKKQFKLTWSAGTYTLSVVAPFQETVNTTDGELETSLG